MKNNQLCEVQPEETTISKICVFQMIILIKNYAENLKQILLERGKWKDGLKADC
jgi:hypothetical protein